MVPYYLGNKAMALYTIHGHPWLNNEYKATLGFITNTRPWPYKVSICIVFDLKVQGIRSVIRPSGCLITERRRPYIIFVIRSTPFGYKAIDGLITKIDGHGFIKSPQLDFSERQMALYWIQGHGLITEVIR